MAYQEILAQCIDAIESCLAKYPEHVAKLEPLLRIVATMEEAPPIQMSSSAFDRGRALVVQRAAQYQPDKPEAKNNSFNSASTTQTLKNRQPVHRNLAKPSRDSNRSNGQYSPSPQKDLTGSQQISKAHIAKKQRRFSFPALATAVAASLVLLSIFTAFQYLDPNAPGISTGVAGIIQQFQETLDSLQQDNSENPSPTATESVPETATGVASVITSIPVPLTATPTPALPTQVLNLEEVAPATEQPTDWPTITAVPRQPLTPTTTPTPVIIPPTDTPPILVVPTPLIPTSIVPTVIVAEETITVPSEDEPNLFPTADPSAQVILEPTPR